MATWGVSTWGAGVWGSDWVTRPNEVVDAGWLDVIPPTSLLWVTVPQVAPGSWTPVIPE